MIMGKNPAWYYRAPQRSVGIMRPGKSSMGDIFNTFILILLGLALTPTINDQVTDLKENLSGVTKTVFELIPLLWVFLVLGIGAAAVYNQFKGL